MNLEAFIALVDGWKEQDKKDAINDAQMQFIASNVESWEKLGQILKE